MLILIYGLIGIAAVATAISLVGPNVDLGIASLIYDPVARQFPWNNPLYRLRDHGAVAVIDLHRVRRAGFHKVLAVAPAELARPRGDVPCRSACCSDPDCW